jgi:hypothetical protein
MKINKAWKTEMAASKDEARPNLTHCHLERDESSPFRGTLVATDGHMMAVTPVTLDLADVAGPVPVEALKLARKLAKKSPDAEVMLSAEQCRLAGQTLDRPSTGDVGAFPNWRKVVPSTEPLPGGTVFRFAVDSDLLSRAASAIGTTGIVLTVRVGEDGIVLDAIRVDACLRSESQGQFAVVMPMGIP